MFSKRTTPAEAVTRRSSDLSSPIVTSEASTNLAPLPITETSTTVSKSSMAKLLSKSRSSSSNGSRSSPVIPAGGSTVNTIESAMAFITVKSVELTSSSSRSSDPTSDWAVNMRLKLTPGLPMNRRSVKLTSPSTTVSVVVPESTLCSAEFATSTVTCVKSSEITLLPNSSST